MRKTSISLLPFQAHIGHELELITNEATAPTPTPTTRSDSLSHSSLSRSYRSSCAGDRPDLSHMAAKNGRSSCSYPRKSFIQSVDLPCRAGVSYNALKSRRSVIKMLSVVVIIYFLSFTPQVLVFLLFDTQLLGPPPHFIRTSYFLAFTMLLVTFSSASNPIVYSIFCSKFRESFLKILRRIFCSFCPSRFHSRSNQRTPSLRLRLKRPSSLSRRAAHVLHRDPQRSQSST